MKHIHNKLLLFYFLINDKLMNPVNNSVILPNFESIIPKTYELLAHENRTRYLQLG